MSENIEFVVLKVVKVGLAAELGFTQMGKKPFVYTFLEVTVQTISDIYNCLNHYCVYSSNNWQY